MSNLSLLLINKKIPIPPWVNLTDPVIFHGEVSTAQFITGDALASQIGLTAGQSQFSNEPWLHFNLGDTVLYVAKKPFRHTVNWDQIDAQGAVFGTRTVVINGSTYKVRLLKGSSSNPASHDTSQYGGNNPSSDNYADHGSEWNRLMYPIHSGVHGNGSNPSKHSDPYSLPFGYLAQYSDADLVVQTGNGSGSWTQEHRATSANIYRLYRGNYGVTQRAGNMSSKGGSNLGWRPVLELIS